MNSLFYGALLKKIRDRRSIFIDRLLSGDIETAEEYKFVSGRVKGFNESEMIIKELFENIEIEKME